MWSSRLLSVATVCGLLRHARADFGDQGPTYSLSYTNQQLYLLSCNEHCDASSEQSSLRLDLGSDVDLASPAWDNFTWQEELAVHSATAVVRNSEASDSKSSIYLFGGDGLGETRDSLYSAKYDPEANQLNAVTAAGSPSPRMLVSAVWSPKASRFVCYGGYWPATSDSSSTNAEATFYSDLFMFDPVEEQWETFNQGIVQPPAAAGHAAVMLDDRRMLVVGGANANGPLPTKHVYMFDTANISGGWKAMTTLGDIPSMLVYASAFTVQGKVVMYGSESYPDTRAADAIFVLDPSQGPWKWYRITMTPPPPTGDITPAAVIGRYLVSPVAKDGNLRSGSLQVYDLTTMKAVTRFQLQTATKIPDDLFDQWLEHGSSLSGGAIAGVVFGCIAGVAAALGTMYYFVYHRTGRRLVWLPRNRRRMRRGDTVVKTMNDMGVLPSDVDVYYNTDDRNQPVIFTTRR
ncbi:hypothetical protein H4R35_005171 [Dimargaris xerosporica]|nr:hypothetical protein H4R35_005171 [Dimargaris xerosporica]